jgi:hypothetical protein
VKLKTRPCRNLAIYIVKKIALLYFWNSTESTISIAHERPESEVKVYEAIEYVILICPFARMSTPTVNEIV